MVSSDAFAMANRRLFIAIEVESTRAIQNFYLPLKKELEEYRVKWMLPEYFHITLRFLGNTPPKLIDPLNKVLEHTASRFHPFEIQLHGLGIFGGMQPKVLWMGIKPTPELDKLYLNVNEVINNLGFKLNESKITPHITLGRINKSTSYEAVFNVQVKHDVAFGSQIVKEICLYESILDKTGARYVILNRHELR